MIVHSSISAYTIGARTKFPLPNQYLENLIRVVENDPALNIGAAGSFGSWVYATDVPPSGGCGCEPILTNGRSGGYCPAYHMDLDSELHFRCGGFCHPEQTATSAATLNLREWTHVACTWDESGVSVFINGELDSTNPGMRLPSDPPQQGPYVGQEPGYAPVSSKAYPG